MSASWSDLLGRRRQEGRSGAAMIEKNNEIVILLLSNNDISNVADDAFKTSFKNLWAGMRVRTRFENVQVYEKDETMTIPSDVSMVFTDVIDGESLRSTFRRLIDSTSLPFYGISVDFYLRRRIESSMGSGDLQPSVKDDVELVSYLRLFDHMIARSKEGQRLLADIVGAANVTYIPDILLGMTPRTRTFQWPYHFPWRTRQLCLVLPPPREYLREDSVAEAIVRWLVRCAHSVAIALRCRLCIMTLNTGGDVDVTDSLVDNINRLKRTESLSTIYTVTTVHTVRRVREVMRDMVAVITVGYHALLFAVQESVPVFAVREMNDVFTSRLIDDILLSEENVQVFSRTDDDLSAEDRHSGISHKRVYDTTHKMLAALIPLPRRKKYDLTPLLKDFRRGALVFLGSLVAKRHSVDRDALSAPVRPRAYQLLVPNDTESRRGLLHTQITENLARMTMIIAPEENVSSWYSDTNTRWPWRQEGEESGPTPLEIATCVLFSLTSSLLVPATRHHHHTRLAGGVLSHGSSLKSETDAVIDDIILDENKTTVAHRDSKGDVPPPSSWFSPPLNSSTVYLGVDDTGSMDDAYDFTSVGWKLATIGLRYMSPEMHGRTKAAPFLRFDPYVDRTFRWGKRALRAARTGPFSEEAGKWGGFVHHLHDCDLLLKDDDFQRALRSCVVLFVTSDATRKTLGRRLRDRYPTTRRLPPVYSVGGIPADVDVPHGLAFDIDKFRLNKSRMLVQAGALWALDVYAIYDLRLAPSIGAEAGRGDIIIVQKALLRTPENHDDALYVPVKEGSAAGRAFFEAADGVRQTVTSYSPRAVEKMICRPMICRPGFISNLFVTGMLASVRRSLSSVVDVEHYDELLSENAVFAKFVDANSSATDIVNDCAIRATPIILNRLPELEEILGHKYPGFYDSMAEAGVKASRWSTYELCHEYLKRHVDVRSFSIERFVQKVNAAVSSEVRL